MTALSSFAALTRSIPSLLTCISPLLLAHRLEGLVLQAPHLGLQQPEVHTRRAAVVLALCFARGAAHDPEEGHPPAVGAADFDCLELAASDKRERPEEEVVRVDHWLTPLDSAGAAVGLDR